MSELAPQRRKSLHRTCAAEYDTMLDTCSSLLSINAQIVIIRCTIWGQGGDSSPAGYALHAP